MRAPTFALAAAVTLVLGAAVAPAHAFDLTGHWIGKWSCKDFDGVKFNEGANPSLMAITEAGGTMNVSIDNVGYNGTAIADAKKPDEKGEAVLISCATSNVLTTDFAEIVRATVKTKIGSFKATFKAVSVFADNTPEVGTCKFSFKRVDTLDPGVLACP